MQVLAVVDRGLGYGTEFQVHSMPTRVSNTSCAIPTLPWYIGVDEWTFTEKCKEGFTPSKANHTAIRSPYIEPAVARMLLNNSMSLTPITPTPPRKPLDPLRALGEAITVALYHGPTPEQVHFLVDVLATNPAEHAALACYVEHERFDNIATAYNLLAILAGLRLVAKCEQRGYQRERAREEGVVEILLLRGWSILRMPGGMSHMREQARMKPYSLVFDAYDRARSRS